MTKEIKIPPEHHFGYMFGAILILIGAFGYWQEWILELWLSLSVIGGVFVVIGRISPGLLRPLNLAWFKLGILLGRIVSPIVLGIIFFVLITPVALIGRLSGRDPLRLKADSASSHWINREPPGPEADSFNNQF